MEMIGRAMLTPSIVGLWSRFILQRINRVGYISTRLEQDRDEVWILVLGRCENLLAKSRCSGRWLRMDMSGGRDKALEKALRAAN